MTERYITLRGSKAEAFERVKETMGPDGVEPSNPDVVMRLIAEYENSPNESVRGGLSPIE